MLRKILDTARTPSFEGTETQSWADVDKTLGGFINGYNKAEDADLDTGTEVGKLPAEAKRWIASKTLLGDPEASEFADLVFFPVVNPDTNRLNAGALRAVLSGRGAQADISDSVLESARTKAQDLLDANFEEDGVKNNELEQKQLNFQVKALDETEDGEAFKFEGYASTFGNVDLGDDVIVAGAFQNSLEKRNPKLLFNHDFDAPMGVVDEAREDEIGLFVRGRMPKENSRVKDLVSLMKLGAVDSFSIGFFVKDFELRDDIRYIKQIELFEVSIVTLPMNPKATLQNIKRYTVDEVKKTVYDKKSFEKALRESGAFSKEACVYLASCFHPPGDESAGDQKQTEDLGEMFKSINRELEKITQEMKDARRTD